eukprot:11512082-Alexandrium_andersonii.AAC.1
MILQATGSRGSQLAPLLGPGVATPGSQQGKPLRRSSTQVLRPRGWRTPRSSSGVGMLIIFREMIAFLMSGHPQTQSRSMQ